MQTSHQSKISEYTAKGWWTDQSLIQIFDSVTASVPSRLAIIDAPNRADFAFGLPRRLTYQDASRCADNFAAALFAQGVRQGDRLLVQLPNIAELLLLYLAASRLGAIISPIPMQYGRHELQQIIAILRPRLLISITQYKGQNIAEAHHASFPDVLSVAIGPKAGGEVELISDTHKPLQSRQPQKPTLQLSPFQEMISSQYAGHRAPLVNLRECRAVIITGSTKAMPYKMPFI